ncbi:hypothetical protein S140_63 [Shewanella sp. phage 1/40]|uniref:hypothetical protein n=1 Tax=Shewanella sp. phage 1/40 TaxID=1458860 RepID=UPI0004F81D18|nr:hypothetical protein S140_63 [Shewanella sp. phage 1/40]AHK11473.1 hypothetical protein S140_63 [Shewanella sp. phage 1/40]
MLSDYDVLVPVAGFVRLTVSAKSKEEASEKALSSVHCCMFKVDDELPEGCDIYETEVIGYPQITSGNFLHVPYNTIEVLREDEGEI